jgi:SpoVK/Ycf46/Vps4 family AAA+-type ATPase
VLRINVFVVATFNDQKAEAIAERVAKRPDMTLVGSHFMLPGQVDDLLAGQPFPQSAAILLVGPASDTRAIAERWVAKWTDVVVMLIDFVDDVIRIQGITLRDPRLDALLDTLHEIVERVGADAQDRVVRMPLATVPAHPEETAGPADMDETCEPPGPPPEEPPAESPPVLTGGGPLLDASIAWLHRIFRDAIEHVPADNGDVHGLSVTRITLLQSLEPALLRTADDKPEAAVGSASDELDEALALAFEHPAQYREPLAVAARAFRLTRLEFRLLLLTLAPEIDFRFQRCIGFLLDEIGRRVGTFGLYAMLLGGNTSLREELGRTRTFDRWLIFDGPAGQRAAADEPLRIDPYLSRWLLGEAGALGSDPAITRATRPEPWPGAALLTSPHLRDRARSLVNRLSRSEEPTQQKPQWLLFDGTDAAGWRALLELGADKREPVRLEAARLTGADLADVSDAGRRVTRWSRLTGRPLIVDVTRIDSTDSGDESGPLGTLLAAVASLDVPAALISGDEARGVRLIGSTAFELIAGDALTDDEQIDALRAAAKGADVWLAEDEARVVASRYPLRVDGLERVRRLASSRPIDHDLTDPRLERFLMAAKEVVAEGLSHLADRLDPVFDLDDVVLPVDRKVQLIEIVDNVRLAHQVLDEWRFGARLPYGRGVTALFFGLSGTGKTMAAMGIARRLNIQLLRLDLSRVVSKYIGDTEKNIDRVFSDAQRTGAAILIDEADALLGRRSEVKDAHDRYANIEVAFLLQRMEAFDGLAILTTNMKQGLDPAFLRRLRFIIDFPRPDAEARERIWRLCLPESSHNLSDQAFRQLARKIDVTGGHIRQITIRAAFIAAAAGSLIELSHIARAAKAELAKLGMPAVDFDVAAGRSAA